MSEFRIWCIVQFLVIGVIATLANNEVLDDVQPLFAFAISVTFASGVVALGGNWSRKP